MKNVCLDKFIKRLIKVGVELKLVLNFPWIYIIKINDKPVKEKRFSEHGYTLAFYPKDDELLVEIRDISEVFKLIRKYK